jgi:hypothetical protein
VSLPQISGRLGGFSGIEQKSPNAVAVDILCCKCNSIKEYRKSKEMSQITIEIEGWLAVFPYAW